MVACPPVPRATARATIALGLVGLWMALLFAGGIIPDADIDPLKKMGFSAIFGPGTSTEDIIKYVNDWAAKRPVSAG